MIRVRGLCYSYDGKVPALDHLDLEIEKGKVTAVLGGNGAGKSTLFLNLNGVLHPDSGEVWLDGEKVEYNASASKRLCAKVGVVFQDPNDQLFSESVRDDIAFGALNLGMSKAEAARAVEKAAERVGCLDLLDKPTHALSFGQKKRVALAGVLVMRPSVMILDEPTAGLDPQGVAEILHLLASLKEELEITIILSTHEIDIVPLYCDYVYVMEQGRAVMRGTPKEIFADPEQLRRRHLRTPRIRHLMEILRDKDGLALEGEAATISQARAEIRGYLETEERDGR